MERNYILPKHKISKRLKFFLYDSFDRKKAFKLFRNSSSAFIANKKIKNYILERDNNECMICGGTDHLQIDHIVSVFRCFINGNYEECNTIDNLQVLCRKCNASKLP